jgi:hypothetical protein
MSIEDSKRIPFPEAHRVCLPFRKLPSACPCCQRRFLWGWMDDDLSAPVEPHRNDASIRIRRIRRPDQTLFCPECEERILN